MLPPDQVLMIPVELLHAIERLSDVAQVRREGVHEIVRRFQRRKIEIVKMILDA